MGAVATKILADRPANLESFQQLMDFPEITKYSLPGEHKSSGPVKGLLGRILGFSHDTSSCDSVFGSLG